MKTGAYFWKDLAQQYCTRIFIWHWSMNNEKKEHRDEASGNPEYIL
jgi:hypothetical protein